MRRDERRCRYDRGNGGNRHSVKDFQNFPLAHPPGSSLPGDHDNHKPQGCRAAPPFWAKRQIVARPSSGSNGGVSAAIYPGADRLGIEGMSANRRRAYDVRSPDRRLPVWRDAVVTDAVVERLGAAAPPCTGISAAETGSTTRGMKIELNLWTRSRAPMDATIATRERQ